MKYFIIEVVKPIGEQSYKSRLQNKINSCEFEVVKVCESLEDAEKFTANFQIRDIKNQTGLHYEIIQGEGNEGFRGLQKELSIFYGKI